MQKDEEMNRREASFIGTIKNTIKSSSETAILEFERICESLGWRRSTIVDNSQKIKRRRNKTDIYKRVLSDNTRRSAVRDMEIQTDSVYTLPKSHSYSINSNNNINNDNNSISNGRPQRSLKQNKNNNTLAKGVLEVLEKKETPPLPQRERSFFSASPQSNAISKTMSTQTQTSAFPEPPQLKKSLLSPERSFHSIPSSIDADPLSAGRKHNLTPSPERITTVSPKRLVTRPTISSESPGSVSKLRSQIEEQLNSPYRSPYRSPTQFNVDRANIPSPERKSTWATDNFKYKLPAQPNFHNNNTDVKRQEQDKEQEQDNNLVQKQQNMNFTSPIRTSSPIRSPYANGSPSRRTILSPNNSNASSPIRSPYANGSPSRRNIPSPNNSSVSPPRARYIPDTPGSVRRIASQIENELKLPYLRPGMVIPKLTSSPIKKAESPTKPSSVLHNVVLKHHQKIGNNDLDFEEEGKRIARLEKEIKNFGTEVSLLGSYNILDSPQPSHVSSDLPTSPITPTTPTLTRSDPSFIPEAPPFIKRPAKELIREVMNVAEEQPIRERPKLLKPTETHKSKMREIIHQLPGIQLRRTDMIRGPNGEMISNPFWNEIYNPKTRNI